MVRYYGWNGSILLATFADADKVDPGAVKYMVVPLLLAGHQHADNLSLYLTAHGHPCLAGSGRFPYTPGSTDDRHSTYARHTAAKNTLVVDGMSQIPQVLSNGLWSTDGAQTSRGCLYAYVPGPTLQLTRAASSEVYPVVELTRTVLVTGAYVLDVYDAVSDTARQYDCIIHVDGDPEGCGEGDATAAEPLGERDGLQYIGITRRRTGITVSLLGVVHEVVVEPGDAARFTARRSKAYRQGGTSRLPNGIRGKALPAQRGRREK